MKLLIVTQAVDLDDPILGFFHRWIEEFATHADRVEVICLKEGRHALPKNVTVHSLGKEKGTASSIVYAIRFLDLIWRLRDSYDSVFVHMNSEYVILGGPVWRFLHKRIGLWYTHGTVSFRLQIASRFSHKIFTASKSSLRLVTPKKSITGHGLDLNVFPLASAPVAESPLTFITVGRVSRVKRVELLAAAVQSVKSKGMNAELSILDQVQHEHIPSHLARAHLFLHASATGSLDKAPLEALASGVPVITTNSELGAVNNPAILFAEPNSEAIAVKIEEAVRHVLWRQEGVRKAARAYVATAHNLTVLVPRLLSELEGRVKTPEPQEFYNKVMPGKLGANYEEARWHSTALAEAQYRMTKAVIEDSIIPYLNPVRSLLEVGPGAATWTSVLLRAFPDAPFTLVDISSEMLRRARLALSERSSVTYVETDLARFAGKMQYDGFFSARAIEYMPDTAAAVCAISAALASSGKGALITKMPKPLFDRLRGRHGRAFHSGMVSPRALSKILTQEGLTVEEVGIATATVPGAGSAILNRVAFTILRHLPLVFPLTVFAESYYVTFRKP